MPGSPAGALAVRRLGEYLVLLASIWGRELCLVGNSPNTGRGFGWGQRGKMATRVPSGTTPLWKLAGMQQPRLGGAVMLEHLAVTSREAELGETGKSMCSSHVAGGPPRMVPLGLVDHGGPEGKKASAESGLANTHSSLREHL